MTSGRKVLVVGSGGREHALAHRLLASPSVAEVIVSPGNAGTELTRVEGKTLRAVSGDPVQLAVEESVDLVVVGPEVPLVEGLADRIREKAIPCYGPSKAAAQLEGSKAFMKDFCKRHGILAAKDAVLTELSQLDDALKQFSSPPVVKADGLCAGKGVVVAETFEEAKEAAAHMLSGAAFGDAGMKVVLEERLLGSEASIHAICDGSVGVLLPAAQDHKRIFEGDTGPNTGGMGTYAPAPVVTDDMLPEIRTEIIDKVVQGMKADGSPFVGTLFAGLMISPDGKPVVLEFNVRFGDPETQVLTQIIEGDFCQALLDAAQGCLKADCLRPSGKHAMCVVLAAGGYPSTPRKGDAISGLTAAENQEGAVVFHAGTKMEQGKVVTSGGRVLGVTAVGDSLRLARERVYAAADQIQFEGCQFRRDIGHRAL